MTDGGKQIINADFVAAFARKLKAGVVAAVQSGIGSAHHEEEFTRIVLDKLGNEGTLENPIPLWQEGTFDAQKYKITGFALADEEDRLLLVTTVYTGDFPPRPLSRDEISTAFKQTLWFYKSSCSGMHERINPANTDAGDLARRIFDLRARGRIAVLRLVIISDGIVPIAPLDIRRASDNTRVIVNTFDIEQLFYILHEGLTNDDIMIDFSKRSVSRWRASKRHLKDRATMPIWRRFRRIFLRVHMRNTERASSNTTSAPFSVFADMRR